MMWPLVVRSHGLPCHGSFMQCVLSWFIHVVCPIIFLSCGVLCHGSFIMVCPVVVRFTWFVLSWFGSLGLSCRGSVYVVSTVMVWFVIRF